VKLNLKLYGKLKELAPNLDSRTSTVGVMELDMEAPARVSDILKELDLEDDEISHVFVNGIYSSITRKLEEKNKVAIFPADMGLLYSWYFEEEE